MVNSHEHLCQQDTTSCLTDANSSVTATVVNGRHPIHCNAISARVSQGDNAVESSSANDRVRRHKLCAVHCNRWSVVNSHLIIEVDIINHGQVICQGSRPEDRDSVRGLFTRSDRARKGRGATDEVMPAN